jgi:hydrogenase expression/formation protein HypD
VRYIDEFRDKRLVAEAAQKLKGLMPDRQVRIMEVCGTHTQSFFRFGLDKIIPPGLRLISGPGCPVCVSAQDYIDRAVALSRDKHNLVLSFGDMLRVPGSRLNLEQARASFGNVAVVYSPWDSLAYARKRPGQRVIFLAVGFETTAPAIALSIMQAKKEKIKNLFFLVSLKLIPPAMKLLAADKMVKLDGFLCPGHVSAIIGTRPYAAIAGKYGLPCCVAGFEPLDILEGLCLLLRRIKQGSPAVDNQYSRVVTPAGNSRAQAAIKKVFARDNASWRGLGILPASGLRLRKEYSAFDARKIPIRYPLSAIRHTLKGCRCADVLKGLIAPTQCPLFKKACRPERPVGPCMVSSEGTCNAYFKYR